MTIVDLAKLAGVSDATVSMVLNGKDRGRVSAERREQILALARQHGYRRNPAARALATGRTGRIGLCVSGSISSHALIGEFSMHVRLGLFAEGIHTSGRSIEIIQIDTRLTPGAVSQELGRRAVDGVVFLDWPRERLGKPLEAIRERGVPAVASGTVLDEPGCTWTHVDEPGIATDAVNRLVSEGRTRIAMLDTVIGPVSADMEESFRVALSRRTQPHPEGILAIRPMPLDYDGVHEAVHALLAREPELQGILLTDNFLAQSVLNALRTAGRRPGADVRVLGYGDTVFADQCRPRLSHYSLRLEEQVRFGLDALTEQIDKGASYEPRHALLAPLCVTCET